MITLFAWLLAAAPLSLAALGAVPSPTANSKPLRFADQAQAAALAALAVALIGAGGVAIHGPIRAGALGIATSAVARRPKSQALFDLATGPDGRPILRLNGDGPLSSGGMFDMLFTQIDRNGDGRLAMAEVQAAARARFDQADANHDGTLSGAEAGAARRQLGILQQALGGAR